MKNKTGLMSGFIIGATGFLAIFNVTFLKHIPPEDELAPGMVVILAIIAGVASACIGSLVQNYFRKEKG